MSRIASPAAPQIPGFEYAEALGEGGFSHVYRYTDLGLGRRSVAVKVLLADVDQAAFQSEASVMAQLGNHPSIVSIYQAGVTTGGRAFLMMEFCPPPHLGLRLRTRPLSVAKALEVVIQLAGAVETAHRLGILHRDIKPANILFTEFGRPALTDFGISEAMGRAEAGQGIGMSPPWAPPEQLRVGAPMGRTGDVYSLAATLWTCLVGRSPFHQPNGANDSGALAQRIRSQPVPRTGRADVPDSLDGVLRVAMAKAADERFGSALELARALQAVQAELHLSVTPIDVRDEPLDLGVQIEERDLGGTHVTGFVAIDPDGRPPVTLDPAALTTGQTAGRSWTGPDEAGTVFAAPTNPTDADIVGVEDAATAMHAAVANPARHATLAPLPTGPSSAGPEVPAAEPAKGGPGRRLALVLGGLIVTVVLGAALAAQALGGSGGGTTPDAPIPTSQGAVQDPLREVVPAPAGVTVTRQEGRLLAVTWTNPAPEAGDGYQVRLVDPVEKRDWTTVAENSARVQGGANAMCVEVRIVRADGRYSNDPARACPQGQS